MGISRAQHTGGGAHISPVARIALRGLAASALALGFAVPAHADTPPNPTSAGVPPAEVTAAAPTTPDVSAAAAGTAAQTGATNVNVSVRVGSPGDNGGVSQAISTAVDAAARIASAPAAASVESAVPPVTAVAAQAAVVQAAPVNVDLSVRVASPGNDDAVTQAITAAATAAAAQTQYQPPAAQYQAPATELPTTAPLTAPRSSTPPAAGPAATSPTVPSLPSTWTWNWTWTCGDITQPGITQTIDTGIQNWVWRWNLGGMCAAPSPLPPVMPPVIPPLQSGGAELILSTPPAPPTLPDLPVVQSPAPTSSLSLAPALVQLTVPVGLDAFAPLFPPAAMPLQPVAPLSRVLLPRRPSTPLRLLDRLTSAWQAAAAPAPRRQHTTAGAPHPGQPNAARPAFLVSSGFIQPPSGGGVASSGGGAGFGAGVTAALAIWILLALPGVAVLRLPASRRGPRANVDDTRTRPG